MEMRENWNVSKESEHVTRCPRCFARDVRLSHKNTLLDSIMGKLHRTPFRCRSCQNRFYVFRDKKELEETAETAARNADAAKPAEP
jgi:hypothetical protein